MNRHTYMLGISGWDFDVPRVSSEACATPMLCRVPEAPKLPDPRHPACREHPSTSESPAPGRDFHLVRLRHARDPTELMLSLLSMYIMYIIDMKENIPRRGVA